MMDTVTHVTFNETFLKTITISGEMCHKVDPFGKLI